MDLSLDQLDAAMSLLSDYSVHLACSIRKKPKPNRVAATSRNFFSDRFNGIAPDFFLRERKFLSIWERSKLIDWKRDGRINREGFLVVSKRKRCVPHARTIKRIFKNISIARARWVRNYLYPYAVTKS